MGHGDSGTSARWSNLHACCERSNQLPFLFGSARGPERHTHTHAEKSQLRLPATYKKAEAGVVESAPTVTHNFELFCVYLEK